MQKIFKRRLIEVLLYLSNFAYLFFLRSAYFPLGNHNITFFFIAFLAITGFLILINLFDKLYLYLVSNFLLIGSLIVYYLSQVIYHRAFDQYYRLNTALGLSKEATGVTSSIFELIKVSDYLWLLGYLVILALFWLLLKNAQASKPYYLPKALIGLVLIGFSVFSYLNFTKKLANQENLNFTAFDIYKSDFYLYDNVLNVNQFVDKFSIEALLIRDSLKDLNKATPKTYANEIKAFFESQKPHTDNEFTNIFKGDNLIVLQAESLMNLAIDPELTPTLYWFKTQGINLENFDSPLLVGSTSDSEFMANTGLIPVTNDGYPVCYRFVGNTYKQTLAKLFKKQDYTTYGFHNNYGEYYNRTMTFPAYGYDKFMDSSALGFDNFVDDSELGSGIGWILGGYKHFLGYWVTVSGHQPYVLNSYGAKNPEFIKKVETKYPNLEKNYQAYLVKAMDFDKALSDLVNVFDSLKILDKTTFVIFGDHRAKGIDFSKDSDFFKVVKYDEHLIKDVGIIFNLKYVQSKGPLSVKKFCAPMDLLPTLANMHGLDLNYQEVVGKDIFDPNYDGFQFYVDGTWRSENFTYNSLDDKLELFNNFPKDKALKDIEHFRKAYDICGKILESDYFKGN